MKKIFLIISLFISVAGFAQIAMNPAGSSAIPVINTAIQGSIVAVESSANVYTGTLTGITNVSGNAYDITFPTANTGSTTFNLNAAGAITLKKFSSGSLVNLVSGDISAGETKRVRYNGTFLVIEGGSSLPTGSDNSFLQTISSIPAWTTKFLYTETSNVLKVGTGISITGSGTRTDNFYLGLDHTDFTAGSPNRWNMVIGERHTLNNANTSSSVMNDDFVLGSFFNRLDMQAGGGPIATSGHIGGVNNIILSENTSTTSITFAALAGGGWKNKILPKIALSGQRVIGNIALGGSHNLSEGYGSAVMGYWGNSSGYHSLVHGFATTFFGDSWPGIDGTYNIDTAPQHTGTVPRILASGRHAINFSANSPTQTSGNGALGDYSGVFAGVNGHVASTAKNSVTIGGFGLQALDSATVVVPNLKVQYKPTRGDTIHNVLVWDYSTGQAKIRYDNTIIGGSSVTSVTGTAPIVSSGGTTPIISISDATTSSKGAASFNSNDFDVSSGAVSFDNVNAQKATTSQNGILTSTDWNIFNNKQNTGLSWLLASGGTLTGANTLTGTISNTLKLKFDNLITTQTDGAGVWLQNSTAATSGVTQQISPSLTFEGQAWKSNATAASQSVKFNIFNNVQTGSAASYGYLDFQSSINAGAYSTIFRGNSTGGITSSLVNFVSSTNQISSQSIYNSNGSGAFVSNGNSLHYVAASNNGTSGGAIHTFSTSSGITATSGTNAFVRVTGTQPVNSSNMGFVGMHINPTWNCTGTTSSVYGINYDPTITAMAGKQIAYNHTSGFVDWNSVVTPSQITSDQNDYNPTGWNTSSAPYGASIMRLSTDASRSITSITGGTNGRLSIFTNSGSNDIILKDDDGSSGTSTNRIDAYNDFRVSPGNSVMAYYDGTSNRWRPIGASSPIRGTVSTTGTSTTVFTVTIGTTMPNTNYTIGGIEALNALSSAVHYVTNKTTTSFDVTYLSGLTGTVSFDWSINP